MLKVVCAGGEGRSRHAICACRTPRTTPSPPSAAVSSALCAAHQQRTTFSYLSSAKLLAQQVALHYPCNRSARPLDLVSDSNQTEVGPEQQPALSTGTLQLCLHHLVLEIICASCHSARVPAHIPPSLSMAVAKNTAAVAKPGSQWLAANPSKRWAELFYLAYSPFWILWALCVLVPFQLYDYLDEWGYLLVGLVAAAPCVLLPICLQGKADLARPWYDRFWVKANVWQAIFGFVGNYIWTHYFFQLLGAAYTLPSHRLNGIPLVMYLMTHAYFLFYHTLSNLVLRRVESHLSHAPLLTRKAARCLVVFLLAYVTAFMETLTISHFPYYTFIDRSKMYSIGSLFYAIYFFVSFPMFMRIDEDITKPRWTMTQVIFESLGSAMLVTLLLDAWRLTVGGIVPAEQLQQHQASSGIIWAN